MGSFRRLRSSLLIFTVCIIAASAFPATAAVTVAPTLTPWTYKLCDEIIVSPPLFGAIVRCEVLLNGTWTNYCTNTSPILEEGELTSKAEEFTERIDRRCNSATSSWTGWLSPGQTLGGTQCSAPNSGPTFRHEVEIGNWSVIHTEGANCRSPRFIASRSRNFQCPDGYTGSTTCTLPQGTPNPQKNNTPCPGNGSNPIHTALGTKLQRETDYVGSGPFALRFERHYTSAHHWEAAAIGTNWRHTYARRIQLISTSAIATATVFRPNGDRFYFTRQSDNTWRSDRDVAARLERSADGWVYADANDTRENYDAAGRLLSITRRGGYTQTLEYDGDGRLETVRDELGRSLGFTYDAAGRIQTLTDPAGGTYTYAYDAAGNLAAVTRPPAWNEAEPPTRTYLYEDARFPYALTGILDENGERYATWAYDEQGRGILSEHGAGADRTELVYNADGSTSVTDALGATRRYTFETIEGVIKLKSISGGLCPSCGGDAQARTYDDNGFLASQTDWNGVTTTYVNNARGLQLSRTEAAGTDAARTIHTEWHPEFRLPVRITEPRKVTEYQYDGRGLMIARTERDRETGAERTWTYTYNDFGLVASADGPRTDVADVTRYDYDPQGNLVATTNAAGHRTQVTAHDSHGRPLSLTDPNGLNTQLSYDARGRLIARNVGGETTGFDYDPVGNLTRITLPDGSHLEYSYDAAHRLVGIADQLGHRIAYTLDAAGNRTTENVQDESNTLVRTRDRVYDQLGRLMQDIGAAGQTTTYAYDGNGNPIAATDPLGNTTTSAFDSLNRLVEQTDPLGGTARYGYDTQGELVTVTDPNGNTTSYTYDGLGNRIREASPDAGITSLTYDAAGNALSKTDANGRTSGYRYDALNRLIEASYADGTTTQYQYDTASNGIGRLARITDPSGSTEWDYDAHGRVTTKRQSIDGRVFETRYAYDAAGRLAAMTYPSGTAIEYTYANGRLEGVTVNGNPLVSDIGYTPFGPVNGWRWANGTLHSRDYDTDGQLTAHTLADDTRHLTYNPVGNITQIADSRVSQILDYDALSRLTAANDARFEQSFAYDANGNRLELREGTGFTAYEYAPDSNRLLAVAADTRRDYQYDANGNTVHDGNHAYTYDARNRLVAVDDGRTAAYRLNALGQRVYKETPTPGDATGDGIIDQNDIRAITGRNTDTAGPGADCNGDGIINQRDIRCIAQKMAVEKSGKAARGGGGGGETSPDAALR